MCVLTFFFVFFFFNDTATTEIYTLSLHDALPISCDETSATIPRPYCAAGPVRLRSVTMSTRVPPFADVSDDSTVARAAPRPRISRPSAESVTRRPASSTCSRLTSVANVSATGPSFTATLAFQLESSTTSVSSAPGMQGTTRGTSSKRSQAVSGGAGTSKEFSSRIAGHLVLGVVLLRRLGARRTSLVPPLDELRQDRHRDLLLRRRAEVETGGAVHAGERFRGDAAVSEATYDGRCTSRARHQPHVVGAGRERAGERVLVAAAHPCDDHGVRAVGDLVGHAPADGLRQLSERPRGRALARHGQERRRHERLDQHVDRALGRAGALRDDHVGGRIARRAGRADPKQPRLAVGQREQRLAHYQVLGAGSANPAVQRPIRSHERPLPAPA